MLLVEIILFYLLYILAAPAWCYILNGVAVLISLFSFASKVGTFLHGTDAALSCEMKNMNGEVMDE